MPRSIQPISIQEFPEISTNCLGFALGLTEPASKRSSVYNLDERFNIADAFKAKLNELGLEIPHQVDSTDEIQPGEYGIMVLGFKPYVVPNPFVGNLTYYDFHVVRRELDGNWVHKPGWDEPPCIVNNWKDLHEEFGHEYVLFAF